MKARFFLLSATLALTSNCLAAMPDADQLAQLSWLTGCWKGTGHRY